MFSQERDNRKWLPFYQIILYAVFMSSPAKIALVGRPNVGKSALFNRICGRRIAIVDEAEGITRDRLYQATDFFGRPIEVIDTGGIVPFSDDFFEEAIRQQTEIAIIEADSLILVVDGQTGPTPLDYEVAYRLFQSGKPVVIAVNKVDQPDKESFVSDFFALGIPHVIGISALHDWHIVELLEQALAPLPLPSNEEEAPQERPIHIAIIGRPNVGKSSLVNYLLSEKRCLVSPLPGTTRDSIDIGFLFQEKAYTLIDTAGIRHKGSEHEVVDKFAAIRTERAIERSDVCLMLVDATEGITMQDKKILTQIEKAGKGCVLVFNKWDLVHSVRMEHFIQAQIHDAPFIERCPKLPISALSGRNLTKIFPLVDQVYEKSRQRITTSHLNRFLEETLQAYAPPVIMGRRLRIYYLTQVDIQPPSFLLFVNDASLLLDSYKRYLLNRFREKFDFNGTPILFHLKGKNGGTKSPRSPRVGSAAFRSPSV